MKHKTATLEGALLDAAVALAQGWRLSSRWHGGTPVIVCDREGSDESRPFCPSWDWSDCGPIIEREGIELHCIDRNGRLTRGEWMSRASKKLLPLCFGPTPLIAAMRAFVASKLGDEVEL